MKIFSFHIQNKALQHLIVLLLIIIPISCLQFLETIIDMMIGDGDGEITNPWIVDILFWFPLLWSISIGGYYAIRLKWIWIIYLISSLALLCVVDQLFYFALPTYYNFKIEYGGEIYSLPDENTFYKMEPNQAAERFMLCNGDTAWKAFTTIDSLGRRKNPIASGKMGQHHANFFGCSFTFGDGLNDHQTLPYYYTLNSDTLSYAYNYGYNGYGPNHILALLQSKNIRKEVSQSKGFGAFVYMYDHPGRVTCDIKHATYDYITGPYYDFDEANNLIRKGNFKKNRYLTTKIYRILFRSNLLKFFKINYPTQQQQYQLSAAIINQMAFEYKKQFPSDPFFLIIYPSTSTEILEHINIDEIEVLDYSQLFDLDNYHVVPNIDFHPNEKANKMVADQLYKDLKRRNVIPIK